MKIKGGQIVKLPFTYNMLNVDVKMRLYASVVSIHGRTVVLKLKDELGPFTGMKIVVKKKELQKLLTDDLEATEHALSLMSGENFNWE